MMTVQDMNVSLEDARFFNEKIQVIVRGPQQGHDVDVIRRYFRAYLHCWKTVLHLVRDTKGLSNDRSWVSWCQRWQAKHLDADGSAVMDQLRTTRDHDTHSGTITISGEVAAGLFPLVFVEPVKSSQRRRELVTVTNQGIEIISRLIATHAAFK
jgi:hypothetical protein